MSCLYCLQRNNASVSTSTVTTPEETQPIAPRPHIHSKTKNWYSSLCNRWLSLFGVSITCTHINLLLTIILVLYFQVALKVFIMFLVHWGYALACILAVFMVWLYVGTANPAVKPGIAAEFHFLHWLKTVFYRCIG